MQLNNAMIIIAVSRYRGAYEDLPGTVNSAKKLKQWAEQPDADRNYNVLYLGDDEYDEITVDLLRKDIGAFLSNNFIDRLVVYFAGHGIVRSAGDQFWLLSNAADDLREGINVEAFRRGLMKFNIGSHSDHNGQVCIIGDACRSTGNDAIEFSGDVILSKNGKPNRTIQLDRFLSTGLGSYSFHVDGTSEQDSYCLFSEIMLRALQGEVEEAIEQENHEFRPVVTNHKLADYLEGEVHKRASEIDEEMEPDLKTGIRPPYNFYKKIVPSVSIGPSPDISPPPINGGEIAGVIPNREASRERGAAAFYPKPDVETATSVEMKLEPTPVAMSFNRIENTGLDIRKVRQQTIEKCKEDLGLLRIVDNLNREDSLIITDFPPSGLAVPKWANTEVSELSVESASGGGEYRKYYEIRVNGILDFPTLLRQGDSWVLVPNFPNTANVILADLPGDLFFLKVGKSLKYEGISFDERWDSYLSDFSSFAGNKPLRSNDAERMGDLIRIGKEKFPHQAVTAGYLYEFANDYENILRTAHYMAENIGSIPFDLGLLCTDKIKWVKKDEVLRVIIDLPSVQEDRFYNSNQQPRPYYARSGFAAKKSVYALGVVPIYSQGWSFLSTEPYLNAPEELLAVGKHIAGRSASNMSEEGFEIFVKFFEYKKVEGEASKLTLLES